MFILAIHPEREFFKVVLMNLHHKKMKIELLHEFKKNLDGFDELFKEIKQFIPKMLIASALPIEDVFLRKIDFPLKSFSSVRKALPFQVESIFPSAEKEVKIITEMERLGEGIRVELLAFRKEVLEKHVQELQDMKLDPDLVTSISLALRGFALRFCPPKPHLVLFHLGWDESYYVYLKDGKIEAAKTTLFGFKEIVDSIEIRKLDKEELSTELLFSFMKEGVYAQKVIQKFVQEHQRVLDYFHKISPKQPFFISYTGYGSMMNLIGKEYGHFDMEQLAITPHLEFDQEIIALHAIEIGIALNFSEQDKKSFQLRTSEMASNKIKKQIRGYLFKIFAVGCALALSMFGGFEILLMEKENSVKKLFDQLSFSHKEKLGSLEKEINNLKKEYKKRQKQASPLSCPKKASEVLTELSKFGIHVEQIDYRLSTKEVKILFSSEDGEVVKGIGKVEKMKGDNVYQIAYPLS
jgi:hypothetical protein